MKLSTMAVGSLGLIVALQGPLSASENASHSGSFYVIPKVLTILGGDVSHGHAELEGDSGYGVGMDLGYAINHNFSVELALTYAENDVVETDEHHHTHKATGKYLTYGLNLAYIHHLPNHIGLLAKVGYAAEKEEISDLHIDETLKGVTYALGLEYGVSSHIDLVLEYEGANVDSTRGESVMFGAKYKY